MAISFLNVDAAELVYISNERFYIYANLAAILTINIASFFSLVFLLKIVMHRVFFIFLNKLGFIC